MALVGEAHILVKAITSGVQGDIDRAFSGADSAGDKAGKRAGASFSRGFQNNTDGMVIFRKFYTNKEMGVFKKARQDFLDLAAKGYVLGAAITAVSGVLGSLIGGLGVVALTITAAAIPALLGLAGVIGTVIVAAGVLKSVFSGVGDALKAQDKATEGAAEREKALARATRDLEDAKYNYNETVKQTQKATKDAADAITDAADAEVDARRAVESAERSYQDSVEATQEALEAVTEAREDAKEAIQQLRFELEGGVISEKKARLEFEKARESLQRVQDLPPNSRARREAELAFAEADLNLRRAIDKTGDLRKKTNQANKEGIDGNKNVLNAEKQLIKARQNQSDAEVAAFKATKELTKATNELNAAREYARAGGELEKKNLRALELAKRAVTDAELAQKEAMKSNGLDEYQKAMENLPPAAQAFVEAMKPIKEALKELRKEMQEEFFPGFTDAVVGLAEVYIPLLRTPLKNIARELGEVARRFKNAFVTPEKQAEIKKIFDDMAPIIRNLGDAFIALASAFTTITAAFSPYVVEFSEFAKKKAEAFKDSIEEKKKTGELNDTLDKGVGVLKDLSAAFGNTFSTIANLLDAATGPGSGGQLFLDWLKQTTADWEKFTAGGDENSGLKTTIRDLADNFTKLADFVGDILVILVKIAASEGFGKFIDKLREAAPIIENVALKITEALPAFGDFVVSLAKFVQLVVDAAPIQLFFNILKGALDGLIFVLDNPIGKAFLAFSGLLLAASVGINKVAQAAIFYKNSLLGAIGNIKKFYASVTQSTIFVKAKTAAMWLLNAAGKALKATLGLLNTVFMQSPIGRIIFLVGLLVGGIVLLYKNSEKAREIIDAAFEKIKEVIEKVWNWIKENWPLLLAILTGPIGLAVLAIVKNWDEIVDFVKGIPAKIKEIATKMWTSITDFLSDTWDKIQETWDTVIDWVKDLPSKLKNAALAIWTWVSDKFSDAFTKLKEIWTNIFEWIKGRPQQLKDNVTAIWSWLSDKFGDAYEAIKDKWETMLNWVKSLPGKIAGAASSMWDGIRDGFKDALNWIIRKWNSFSLEARFPDDFIVPFLRGVGFTLNTPNIPEFAKGGIVYPSTGGTLGVIAEAGRPERIEPLDPDGLSKRDKAMIQMLAGGAVGGINITVNPSPGMDERELAALVSRQLAFQLRKGAA
jgi:phage-related protein